MSIDTTDLRDEALRTLAAAAGPMGLADIAKALGLYVKEDMHRLAKVLHQIKADGIITATPDPDNARRLHRMTRLQIGRVWRVCDLKKGLGFIKAEVEQWARTSDIEAVAVSVYGVLPHEGPRLLAAKDWLLELLATRGSMKVTDIQAEAEAAGFAWRLIRNAKEGLGIPSKQAGFHGGWMWEIRTDDT